MLTTLLAQKVAAAAVGVVLATSGLAYAGAPVPNPVQAAVNAVSGSDNGDNGVEAQDENDNGEVPEEAEAGQATAEEKRQAAEDYTDAVREWTECVRDAAAAQGDDETRENGRFDPRADCDERPNPHDFGLSNLPEQADERAETAREEADQRREDGRQQGEDNRQQGEDNRPQDAPDQDTNPSDDAEQDGKPDDTPSGQDDAPTDRRGR